MEHIQNNKTYVKLIVGEEMSQGLNTLLSDVKQEIDHAIEQILKNDNNLIDGLYKSAAYSIGGGKRVRAVFVYLVGQMFNVPKEKLKNSACAVEMIHAASLIVDDLPYMDDSQLRRGKPANHVVFGQDVALCASIALISESVRVVLHDPNLDLDIKNSVAEIIVDAFGFDGLAGGQFVDLKLKRKNIDLEILEYINSKKTAALFTGAGKIAAVIGNASPKEIEAISTFSENIGFAFQIIDDLLDVKGDKKLLGKEVNQDKFNFINIIGLEESKKYAEKYTNNAQKALDFFDDKADNLRKFSSYLINRYN